MEQTISEKIRIDAGNLALDALGYYYIYSQKIKKLERWLKASKVLGIIVPVFLGGMLSTYSTYPEFIQATLLITGPIALGQLVLSAYLTITGADEALVSHSSRAAEYNILAQSFTQLMRYPDNDEQIFKGRFELLQERERQIGKGNLGVSDKERRKGMRYGLWINQRKCAGCKETPKSLEPSNCNVCGNF